MLQKGSAGENVRQLQGDLNRWRAINGLDPIDVDGIFGEDTKQAVQQFQRAAMQGETPLLSREQGGADGICGANTRDALSASLLIQRPASQPAAQPASQPEPASFFPAIPDMISNLFASPAAAAVPAAGTAPFSPTADRLLVPRPLNRDIWAADILETEEYDAVMRRTGLSQRQLASQLDQLSSQINALDETVRGSVVLAVREMYLAGHPVTLDARYPLESQPNAVAVHFQPLASGQLSRGARRDIEDAADERGLHAELYNDNSFRLTVDLNYESMNELRRDLEAIHGDEPIRPIHPMPGYEANSNFGPRRDPFHGRPSPHYGIDIKTGQKADVPVLSTMPGIVREVRHSRSRNGYGNEIVIEDIYGVRHRYAHLDDIQVTKGQVVQQGDPIATAGTTGRSTGIHLHYERIEGGRHVDPMNVAENSIKPERQAKRAHPRQLVEATVEVAERQVARIERAVAAAEVWREEMVQNAADVTDRVVEGASNLAREGWRAVSGIFRS